MEYCAPIAAIVSPPLRYDQRGNMRGINQVKGCIAHCNRHWRFHCPAPDPTLDQILFLNPINAVIIMQSCTVMV
jgi:hypothetical protein